MEVEEIGPGRFFSLVTQGSGQRDQALLVSDERIRTEKNAFDPTEYGSIGANAERKAENR